MKPSTESGVHHNAQVEQDQTPIANAQGVDLNHATAGELGSIEGVGEQVAAEIVEYRTHAGHFLTWEDLSSVPGVSAEILKRIQQAARIGAA